MALKKAEPIILRAFLSGKVAFTGKLNGIEKDFNAFRCRSTPAIDVVEGTIEAREKGTVQVVYIRPISSSELEGYVPNPSSPFADPLQPARIDAADADFKKTMVGKALRWTEVRVKTAGLLAYLEEQKVAEPRRDKPNLKRGKKEEYDWKAIEKKMLHKHRRSP